MESDYCYKLSIDETIYRIVYIWPVETVADFLENRSQEVDFRRDSTNYSGRTALEEFVYKLRSEGINMRDEEIIVLLLKFGASPLKESYLGLTVISRIIRECESTKLIIQCLEYVKDINSHLEDSGVTALYLAVEKQYQDVLEYIMTRNPDVNVQQKKGRTPLHESTLGRNSNITRILLENGANVDACDEFGGTPIFNAVFSGIKDQVKLLLEHQANVNVRDDYGRNPLHAYCASEADINLDILKMLLDAGSDPNQGVAMGCTIIHDLIKKQSICLNLERCLEIVDLLIQYGATLNNQDRNGDTPLHLVSRICPSSSDFIMYLLHRGADPDITNENKKTFIDVLKDEGHAMDFLQYMLICESQGSFYFSPNIQRSIRSHEDLLHHESECRSELKVLIDTQLGDTRLSLFDILSSSERRIAKFIRLIDTVKDVMSKLEKCEQFPIFGMKMRENYRKALQRSIAEFKVVEYLCRVSNGTLDGCSIEEIIANMSRKEIINIAVLRIFK